MIPFVIWLWVLCSIILELYCYTVESWCAIIFFCYDFVFWNWFEIVEIHNVIHLSFFGCRKSNNEIIRKKKFKKENKVKTSFDTNAFDTIADPSSTLMSSCWMNNLTTFWDWGFNYSNLGNNYQNMQYLHMNYIIHNGCLD